MCMFDDAAMYEVYATKQRTARKQHSCTECSREIRPGERYEVATGLFDGRWDTHKTCQHCVAACGFLLEWCGGFLHNAVREDIHEHVGEYPVARWPLLWLDELMGRQWSRHGELVDVGLVRRQSDLAVSRCRQSVLR